MINAAVAHKCAVTRGTDADDGKKELCIELHGLKLKLDTKRRAYVTQGERKFAR